MNVKGLKRLRDLFVLGARRSAPFETSSGMDTAFFIQRVTASEVAIFLSRLKYIEDLPGAERQSRYNPFSLKRAQGGSGPPLANPPCSVWKKEKRGLTRPTVSEMCGNSATPVEPQVCEVRFVNNLGLLTLVSQVLPRVA